MSHTLCRGVCVIKHAVYLFANSSDSNKGIITLHNLIFIHPCSFLRINEYRSNKIDFQKCGSLMLHASAFNSLSSNVFMFMIYDIQMYSKDLREPVGLSANQLSLGMISGVFKTNTYAK